MSKPNDEMRNAMGGKRLFTSWGSTKNRDTLKLTIADVFKRFGEMEVVDLDTPNVPALAQSGGEKTPTKESNS